MAGARVPVSWVQRDGRAESCGLTLCRQPGPDLLQVAEDLKKGGLLALCFGGP